MKAIVTITNEFHIEIPDDKVNEMLKDYNEVICDGPLKDMLFYIARQGDTPKGQLIEGIGYVGQELNIDAIHCVDEEIQIIQPPGKTT